MFKQGITSAAMFYTKLGDKILSNLGKVLYETPNKRRNDPAGWEYFN
jgi:hypothetical protein